MPNAFGMIDESIWRRDREFRALPRGAQCTFLQLLSQRDVDCAGILTLHVDLLAKGCDEITPEDIRHDLKTLEAARFVYVDDDTDELLIRSYARRVSARSPNQLKAALKVAKGLASPKLRHVLAEELRRINKAGASATANEIDPGGIPSERDTQPHTEPLQTPSETDNPSEPLREPPSYSSVTDQISPSVGTYVGEHQKPSTTPRPPETCADHRDNPDAPDCRRCANYRKLAQRWDVKATERRADFWDQVRSATCCDPSGMIYNDHDQGTRCPNHDWTVLNA